MGWTIHSFAAYLGYSSPSSYSRTEPGKQERSKSKAKTGPMRTVNGAVDRWITALEFYRGNITLMFHPAFKEELKQFIDDFAQRIAVPYSELPVGAEFMYHGRTFTKQDDVMAEVHEGQVTYKPRAKFNKNPMVFPFEVPDQEPEEAPAAVAVPASNGEAVPA